MGRFQIAAPQNINSLGGRIVSIRLNFNYGCFCVCDEATVKRPEDFEPDELYYNPSRELVKVELTDPEKQRIQREYIPVPRPRK